MSDRGEHDPAQALKTATRRHFFRQTGFGIGAMALGSLLRDDLWLPGARADAGGPAAGPLAVRPPHFAPKAKNVIYLFMAGAPSQVDLFDFKPKLKEFNGKNIPDEFVKGERFAFIKGKPRLLGSPYAFQRCGRSGAEVSELLPHTAAVADELAILRSVHTTQFNHAPAQIFMNSGHQIVGRPSMGSWLTYGLGSESRDLPGFVVLLSGENQPDGGKSCWGSGFLPTVYQGVEFRSKGDPVLFLTNPDGVRPQDRRSSLDAIHDLNEAHLKSAESLLLTLADWIAGQLDLEARPDPEGSARSGPSMNFGRYLRREVLGPTEAPLVWGLDEVDRLFTCAFASEVFGMFRSWHNARSLDPAGPWSRLTLAIAYAREAHLFITDMNQSPFNVGTRLTLEDFTREQVADLNQRYGLPLQDAAEVDRYYRLVGGHPYLVRRGLLEMATEGIRLADFEAQAVREEGVFGDHLRRMLVLLVQDRELPDVVRAVIRGGPCPSEESFYRLRSAGVFAGESARDARPRCQLYATYLERHLR